LDHDDLGITAIPLRDLGLRDAEDTEIFACAKAEGVILMLGIALLN
jgi:predicted nuclease of predicted toxin-antitoxin system